MEFRKIVTMTLNKMTLDSKRDTDVKNSFGLYGRRQG